jgi:hypothetical protein
MDSPWIRHGFAMDSPWIRHEFTTAMNQNDFWPRTNTERHGKGYHYKGYSPTRMALTNEAAKPFAFIILFPEPATHCRPHAASVRP